MTVEAIDQPAIEHKHMTKTGTGHSYKTNTENIKVLTQGISMVAEVS